MTQRVLLAIIIPCLLLGFGTGCKKGFLDETLYSNISSDNFWQNANDAKAGLSSAYTLALSYGPRDCRNFFMTTDVITDDMDDAYNNTEDERRQIQNFNFSPNNSYFNNSWVSLYKTIAQANAVIQNVPNIATMSSTDKNIIVGEAKFLRALEYYYLVQQWGSVPLDTIEVKTIGETQIPKSPVADIYSLIVRDLQFADANCADAPPAVGRASKWAAKSLLGKVYLILAGPFDKRNTPMLELAEAKLKEVISSNRFSLAPKIIDYFDINKKNSTEAIFEHYTIGDVSDKVGSFMHRNFLPGSITSSDLTKLATSGYGAWTPTTDLWSLYRPADDRLKWYSSYYTKKNSDGTYKLTQYNVPYIFKYVDSNTVARDYKANNLPVLRYADVLLMYAEVLNELVTTGPSGNQYYYLNLVRKRAFSSNPTAYILPDASCTQAQFRDTLMKERRLEFAHEGQRLFDLKRTGTYLTTMTALAAKDQAQLSSSPVPTFKATYPGGVYPNPTGPVAYSSGTITFTVDFLKNSKTVAPQNFQLLLPIPYLQLQSYDIGQNDGY
jgi:starch-binding outer membrane protein, SusD/RagB family